MASLYKRPNSDFWWVKFRDPATGEIKRESTKCRVGIGAHLRRAREICAGKTRAENQAPITKQHAPWEVWVTEFLNNHYATKPKTLLRYLGAWKSLTFARKPGANGRASFGKSVCGTCASIAHG